MRLAPEISPDPSVAPAAQSLTRRLGETAAFSPLCHRARTLGLCDHWDLLALAIHRGARHYAGLATSAGAQLVGVDLLSDEELIVLLLHGRPKKGLNHNV